MRSEERPVNHELVILARESRGFTQTELARQLGMTQSAYSRIEGGLRGISDANMKRLSGILGYPPTFFMQTRRVQSVGLVEVFHRKRQSISTRTMDKIYALIDMRTAELFKMLKGVDIGDIDIRPTNVDDFDGSAKEVARLVRAAWRIPHGPVSNVTAVVEHARVVIIPFDFETSSIDAISHWPPGMPPIVFVNKFSPTDRLRFTLSHELGHIVMHQKSPTPELEKQANEFAAEFLMPERDVRPYLSDLSLEKLAALKPFWKVSMAALLKRAVDLQTITPRRGRTLWMQISQAGFKVREPVELDIPPESPTLLNEIVTVYAKDRRYTTSELANMLCLSERETRDIYFNRAEEIASAIEEAESIVLNHNKTSK